MDGYEGRRQVCIPNVMVHPGSGSPWEWLTLRVAHPRSGDPWEWHTLGLATPGSGGRRPNSKIHQFYLSPSQSFFWQDHLLCLASTIH